MTAISRKLLAGSVAARLLAVDDATGYYGQIGRLLPGAPDSTPLDPPVKPDRTQRVQPYFVVYPGTGSPGLEPDRGDRPGDLTQPFQITAAAGDIDDLLALVDRIDVLLLRWTPDLGEAGEGLHIGYLRRPPGVPNQAPVLVDRQHSPARLYTPLQYQLTATT